MSSSPDRRNFLEQSTALAGLALGGWLAQQAGQASPAAAAPGDAANAVDSPEARLKQLGVELPTLSKSTATLVPAVLVGNLLFVSGHGPRRPDGTSITGKVGSDLTVEQGQQAARVVGYSVLAAARQTLGSLDRIVRTVKVLGMVNATPEFTDHPKVINGFSDFLVEVFGDNGKGARSAVGMVSLPGNIAVEVEAIFEVRA